MSPLQWARTSQTLWCVVVTVMVIANEVMSLSGPNVCMVQQKYNITKRVKYRAPMSVRTYEWCFSMPPRCSKWSTEMRDLTRLETEERTAEVAVCCPGYKMKDVSCVPICPSGKMGHGCSQDCPPDKWGPNCVNQCPECLNGFCVPSTGECDCEEGWQGESCQVSMSTIQAAPALMEELLTTTKSTTKTLPTTKQSVQTTKINVLELTTNIPTTVTTLSTIPTTRVFSSTQKTEFMPTTLSNLLTRPTSFLIFANTTMNPPTTEWIEPSTTEKALKVTVNSFIYNRTETSEEGTSNNFSTEHDTTMEVQKTTKSSTTPLTLPSTINVTTTTALTTSTTSTTTTSSTTTPPPTTSTTSIPYTSKIIPIISPSTSVPKIIIISTTDDIKMETRKIPETTTRTNPTTVKFKPKEIWIRPTQKGDPIFIETKMKSNHDLGQTKLKSATNKIESTSENTTPKTIIVSIIPTSVSHATFKKIAFTTAAYLSQKTNTTMKSTNRTEQGFTKSMISQVSTATPFTIKLLSTINTNSLSSAKSSTRFLQRNTTLKVTPPTSKVFVNTNMIEKHINSTKAISNTTLATSMTTNSMLSTLNAGNKKLNSSISLTTKPTNKQHIHKNSFFDITTVSVINKRPKLFIRDEAVNKKIRTNRTASVETAKTKSQENHKAIGDDKSKATNTKRNVTKTNVNTVTTQEPSEDETFHILTEPEHITAVMNDKERDHQSVDLISVISIAGGVMMAVITIAVIIVMIERCKRPRYDDVRKINDIRMQVMIDNSEVPPPYVRSIFHTPLPDPPSLDRCHYQPISTLDRNLKQFMRPVVVQTISPVMLENFRGILECHYDHLPRRNHDFGTMPTRYSVSPSMKCDDELNRQRPLSVADYTIEALKREAKLDMIDNTTSEPLYAEIPCWRPPSEHAIEVLNLNGEAVTEL